MTFQTTCRMLASGSAIVISTALMACHAGSASSILLFNGSGTSTGDVAALKKILTSQHLSYSTVGSWQLNRMTASSIRGYRLLIVPGGNFEEIGNSLTASTTTNIRKAIQNGLNYLGICAGAFFAGNSPYNGLYLTSGVRFPFYAAEARGMRKAVVTIALAGGQTLDQYWEDGPQLTGWGTVVGKYPDGAPAIVEGTCGSGWVVLTGVHPEAPTSWQRGMNSRTAVDSDHAYSAALVRAALNGEWLPHY